MPNQGANFNTLKNFKRGWHIARLESAGDFAEVLYSNDVFAASLADNIREIKNRITTNTYRPHPLFNLEVPKGVLAFRPGSTLNIQDRVVLCSIVLSIAEKLDNTLSDCVYSWRVKKPFPKKGNIFHESKIIDLPYLKKKTIKTYIDPTESWYEQWPEFDLKTRYVFETEGYNILATSDIAAYFENIQLPILRDQLIRSLPDDTDAINLLMSFLEVWAERTNDGRVHHRGIPQGNSTSSFLGNLFLAPLDNAIIELSQSIDIKYFRYMDDVRIFAKKPEDARLAILHMARTLRSLHLNVQTAKTKIFDEKRGEITALLTDIRVDQLSIIIEEVKSNWSKKAIPTSVRSAYLKKLSKIAHAKYPGKNKLVGTKAPLEGLDSRAFLRWILAHQFLGSDAYVERLMDEISKSADPRLTQKLLKTTQKYPRKRLIENRLLKLISNNKIISPHQEAECLRALRYLSNLGQDTIAHCWKRLLDNNNDTYLRMEAAYLLSRTEMSKPNLKTATKLFNIEPDHNVRSAITTLLVQEQKSNNLVVISLVFHPNEKISGLGKLYRIIKNDPSALKRHLDYIFNKNYVWNVCDYMAFIQVAANSKNRACLEVLLESIKDPRNQLPYTGIKSTLKNIFTRTKEELNK